MVPFPNFKKPASLGGKTWIPWSLVIALAVLLLIETVIIIQQKQVNQSMERESAEAFNLFMKKGLVGDNQVGTNVLFKNVRFCWSKAVCINSRELTATISPIKGTRVNFDNLNSYIVNVHNATTFITPVTLQGMFNESVFNYPNSSLRNLTVSIDRQGSTNKIKLGGSLKYFLWIPFQMDTVLSVDAKTNTLVISVDTLKVFGFIPAKWLIQFKPFNLEKLLTLPPNQHLIVHDNMMMVKPFGLFPPPRISGKISLVKVLPEWIELQFAGKNPVYHRIPQPGAGNYIYLEGGSTQFGKIGMLGTQIQVIDRDPKTLFQFSLRNYLSYLPTSDVQLTKQGGAVLHMVDHINIPSFGSTPNTSSTNEDEQISATAEQAGKPKSFVQRFRQKLKDWFGI